MSVKIFSHIQWRKYSDGVQGEYLDLTWREITRWRMKESRDKLHKLWFTKRHCDNHVEEDEMELTCNTPDRDAMAGKQEGKVHLRRAGSRRMGNVSIHLREWDREGGRRWNGFTSFKIQINCELL